MVDLDQAQARGQPSLRHRAPVQAAQQRASAPDMMTTGCRIASCRESSITAGAAGSPARKCSFAIEIQVVVAVITIVAVP
ncbi:MAG: hypothetical protein KGH73_02010 [Xanthomonadaceae bacterium]|nr:hypothetical protein [Xanthomonadaceae bacterium]